MHKYERQTMVKLDAVPRNVPFFIVPGLPFNFFNDLRVPSLEGVKLSLLFERGKILSHCFEKVLRRNWV